MISCCPVHPALIQYCDYPIGIHKFLAKYGGSLDTAVLFLSIYNYTCTTKLRQNIAQLSLQPNPPIFSDVIYYVTVLHLVFTGRIDQLYSFNGNSFPTRSLLELLQLSRAATAIWSYISCVELQQLSDSPATVWICCSCLELSAAV